MTKKDYVNKYLTRMQVIESMLKDIPGYDGTQASYEFDETATAEEVVGYYIYNETDNALNQWLTNIKGLELTEQDKEVTKILLKLYRNNIKKYNVHFSGYFGYDVTVRAINEDEAMDIAQRLYENAPMNQFIFELENAEITDEM